MGFVLHPSSACIRTDPALLDTILKNLVCNALRYTVEGRVVVGCRRQGEWLRIEIHDTGRGIAADELGLIWQDFFRSSRSVQEYPGGYGLGLSIVRRLANQLGHSVEVTTKPGRGSCFTVKVPLSDPTAPRCRERRVPISAGRLRGCCASARHRSCDHRYGQAAGGGMGRYCADERRRWIRRRNCLDERKCRLMRFWPICGLGALRVGSSRCASYWRGRSIRSGALSLSRRTRRSGSARSL